MTDSNAVEYARKEDAIQDLKEEYQSERRIVRTLFICTVICLAVVLATGGYGMFIDGEAITPVVLFAIHLPLGILCFAGWAVTRSDREMNSKKKLRDAEREFKYWSIENPPC